MSNRPPPPAPPSPQRIPRHTFPWYVEISPYALVVVGMAFVFWRHFA